MQDEEESDRPTVRLRRVRKEAAEREGNASDAEAKPDGEDRQSTTDPMSWQMNGAF